SGRLKGDVVIANADKIDITGGKVIADSAIVMTGKEIDISSTTDTNKDGTTVINKIGKLELTGNNENGVIYVNADNKLSTKATDIQNNSVSGKTLIMGGEIELATIKTSHNEKFGEATDKNHRIVKTTEEVGTNITGIGDIQVIATNGKLIGTAVNIDSENGKTSIYGKDGIDIKEGRKTLYLDEAYKTKSHGLLSSKTTNYHIQRNDDLAINSNITGKEVLIQSQQDIALTGTNAVSDNGTVIYSENGDVKIKAAGNFYNTEEEKTVKKSGLLGTGGIGFTIGQQKTKTESDNTALIHSGSMVGSLNGDTTIFAGKNYEQVGSTVSAANGETVISGSQVDIKAAENKNEDKYKQTFEQKGLTIALNVPVIAAAQSVAQGIKQQGKSGNSRVNALNAANTILDANKLAGSATGTYNAAKGLMQNGLNAESLTEAAQGSGISVSITYGQQKNQSESQMITTQASASQVKGTNTAVIARNGAMNIIGSDVYGLDSTYLQAAKDVNIQAFRETETERSSNKSFGWNAGVAITFDNGFSAGITGGANYGKGHGNGDGVSWRN
ncbi:MAG: hemagglutinin repeat-containing protein, partial [Neisseriaceae bacterium]|nr:hemagglutinin repeat-containing protein [Neisseriaceae bacterium]